MKERIHEQIGNDLKQATRMDTTITIIAIVVTFILLGVAMGFAFNTTGVNYSSSGTSSRVFVTYTTIIMFISIIAIIAINGFSINALFNNRARRAKLTDGLVKLYKEEGIDQYYDSSVLKGYEARCNLFTAVLATIAATGIIVPLVIFINQIVNY
jgi:uncharacterized protein (DUF983 family)